MSPEVVVNELGDIAVFKIFILGAISWDIQLKIKFYGDTQAAVKRDLRAYIDHIPPKIKILNMAIPILMRFCSFVSNWSVTSRIMLHVIQRNVT